MNPRIHRSLCRGAREYRACRQRPFSLFVTLAAEQLYRFSLRTQHVHDRVRSVLQHHHASSLGLGAPTTPNATDHPPLVAQPSSHRIHATFGHLAIQFSQPASERPTRADRPRRVQNDNGVRSKELNVERLVVVSVHNPSVARKKATLLRAPFFFRRPHPARLPVMKVEMNYGQSRCRCQCPRESAFSRTRHPDNKDSTTDGRGCRFHLPSILNSATIARSGPVIQVRKARSSPHLVCQTDSLPNLGSRLQFLIARRAQSAIQYFRYAPSRFGDCHCDREDRTDAE